MADTKISAMTDGTTASGTDDIPVNRGGTNYRITPAYIKTYINGLANTWSVNSAASAPAVSLTGTWYTGGTATTNKPHFLIEGSGATSTGWVGTAGTGLGINSISGFTGRLLDTQKNGVSVCYVRHDGVIGSDVAFSGGMMLNSSSSFVLFGRVGSLPSSPTIGIGDDGSGTPGVRVGSGQFYSFSSASGATGSADTAIYRNAAGVVEINSGTAAAYRNMKLRTLLAVGGTTTANLNLGSSTAPASPADGDVWFDGTDVKIRVSGSTKTFTII